MSKLSRIKFLVLLFEVGWPIRMSIWSYQKLNLNCIWQYHHVNHEYRIWLLCVYDSLFLNFPTNSLLADTILSQIMWLTKEKLPLPPPHPLFYERKHIQQTNRKFRLKHCVTPTTCWIWINAHRLFLEWIPVMSRGKRKKRSGLCLSNGITVHIIWCIIPDEAPNLKYLHLLRPARVNEAKEKLKTKEKERGKNNEPNILATDVMAIINRVWNAVYFVHGHKFSASVCAKRSFVFSCV